MRYVLAIVLLTSGCASLDSKLNDNFRLGDSTAQVKDKFGDPDYMTGDTDTEKGRQHWLYSSHNEDCEITFTDSTADSYECKPRYSPEQIQAMMNMYQQNRPAPMQPYYMRTAPVAPPQPVPPAMVTDFSCVNHCTAQGFAYGLCQSKCSGSTSLPAGRQMDFNCLNRCRSTGTMYSVCADKCSY